MVGKSVPSSPLTSLEIKEQPEQEKFYQETREAEVQVTDEDGTKEREEFELQKKLL